jgi:parallel beta-helix repeat protein
MILNMMRFLKVVAGIVFLLLLFMLFPLSASAQEEREPITWSGIKEITSDYYLSKDDVLVIEPGTEVIFKSYDWSIIIEGRVEAIGTEDEMITFHAEHDISNAWKGMFLYQSDNKFQWCNFSHGSYLLYDYAGGQEIKNCEFYNGGHAIRLDGDGSLIEDCQIDYQVQLGLSIWGNNNIVKNCVIRDCPSGAVFLKNNHGNEITNCQINPPPNRWQVNGIRMYNSSNNRISNCSFEDCHYAVRLEYESNGNLVTDCEFMRNEFGVYQYSTPDHEHEGEEYEKHKLSRDNTITYNRFFDNEGGIMIVGKNNLIMGNHIENSSKIGLCFGVEDSGENQIYLNNFMDNKNNCDDVTSGNVYYNSMNEGNYWSDNNNSDDNGDGISDEPFGEDLYPLAEPLEFINGRLEDFDTDGDGIMDYRDPDDDNDGYPDWEEKENDWDPKDPKDPGSPTDDSPGPLITAGLFVFIVIAVIVFLLGYLQIRKNRKKEDD